MHRRFILRQITSSLKQTAVFIACVALSLVTLVSLGGFGESVNNSLLRDARKLMAADIEVRAGFPFQKPLAAELERLGREPGVAVAATYEFITVVRQVDGEETLLSELKVVEPGYPFYGAVGLHSGRPFAEVLRPGRIVVGENLLDRLDLRIGDRLRVGEATLTIADVVLSEPDQPVDFFSRGPRIFIAAADLPALELIRPGSRVRYRTLLRVDDGAQVEPIAAALEAAAEPRQERVDTFLTNQSAVQRFFENLLTFLNLIGIFTLMLAGIGIQSSLTAFLKEREDTIAILRTFGATGRFVITQYFAAAAVLGLAGTVLGLGLGILLQALFPFLFAPFLPPQVEFILSTRAIVEGVVLGLFVVVSFTFIPLYQLQGLKPNFIFRKETLPVPRTWIYYGTLAAIIAFFAGLVYFYLRHPERTAYFAAGAIGLVALTAVLTRLVLSVLRRGRLRSLPVRQALRGLFRPRNATAAIIVTLATSLAVLFTIYLIERNLDASFVAAYPADAPNVILLDIQPDQREGVAGLLGRSPAYLPIVSARIRAINGREITADRAPDGPPGDGSGPTNERGQRLSDPFSLTYRPGDGLLDDERLVSGRAMFAAGGDGPAVAQVSIDETFLPVYPFAPGDRIRFEIQGVPLEAEVVSIRAHSDAEEGFQPRFTFVLREEDLAAAPQMILSTLFVPPEEIAALQNRLVAAYPNITVINISATIDTLAELVGNITTVIRFFTLFSMIAGVLIIISSVLATRFARIQEAAYFKVLGAKKRFVLRVFALENFFIGLVSAFLALLLSQLAGWILVTRVLELDYVPYWGSSILLLVLTVFLVMSVGLLASASILRKKPITFLREQTVE